MPGSFSKQAAAAYSTLALQACKLLYYAACLRIAHLCISELTRCDEQHPHSIRMGRKRLCFSLITDVFVYTKVVFTRSRADLKLSIDTNIRVPGRQSLNRPSIGALLPST